MAEDFSSLPKDATHQDAGASTLDAVASPESNPFSILDPGDEAVCRELLTLARNNSQVLSEIVVILDTSWSSSFESLIELLLHQSSETIRSFLKKCPHSTRGKFFQSFRQRIPDVTEQSSIPLAEYVVELYRQPDTGLNHDLVCHILYVLQVLSQYQEAAKVLSTLNFSVVFSSNAIMTYFDLLRLSKSSAICKVLLLYARQILPAMRQPYQSTELIGLHPSTDTLDPGYKKVVSTTSRPLIGHLVANLNTINPKSNHISAVTLGQHLHQVPTFFVQRYSPQALEALKQARRVIPDFVSSATYHELALNAAGLRRIVDQDITNHHIGNHGFREVYAGETLNHVLRQYEIPVALLHDIFHQVFYCLIMLLSHGIDHKDPNNNNFNVRWLLQDSEGTNRTLAFTYSSAINKAKLLGHTITPIVTLRDFEHAEFDHKKRWSIE